MILAFCDRSYIVEILLIVKTFFKIACYLAPLIVSIISIVHIFKVVMNGKDDDLKDALKVTVKRIIAGLVICFLPSMINYVFTGIVDASEVEFLACFESASKEKVQALKQKEEAEEEAKKRAQDKEDEAQLRRAYEEEQKQRDAKRESYEEWKKRKEEEERKKREQQQQQGGGSGSGSIIANVPPGTSNIIIGDSRTVGMCASITGDWSLCQFTNGGKSNGADYYIAQGSMGYSWFESTAVPAVNQILANNPGTKYNIYTWMGVNFLLYDIDKYVVKYNELVNGAWKGHKVILVSVGPVNEAVEAENGYSTKNADIQTFNAKLKNGVRASNVSYCDIFTPLGSSFGTGDGLHYSGETYKKVYNLMKQC